MKLSVVIITKNEVQNIQACLASVSFADQIVVVDSGSKDGTIELAKAAGAAVIETADWPGFGPQKARALAAATGDWILSLDADERVSPRLQKEILFTLSAPTKHSAYRLPRFTNFCGSWIRHSGWYPDYVTRLFKKDSARFSDDLVHESVIVENGIIGTFKSPIIHYSFRTQNDFLRKLHQYATLGAEQAKKNGRKSSVFKALAFALIDFVRRFFGRLGFLDGRAGFIIAVLSAESMFHKYLGLALLNDPKIQGDPPPPADLFE